MKEKIDIRKEINAVDKNKKYECPCCNYYTLPNIKAHGYICPVCYWEIDLFTNNDNIPSISNHSISLNQAKLNFLQFGASEKAMIKNVRKPNIDELPKNNNGNR